jgi:hypothetical protein
MNLSTCVGRRLPSVALGAGLAVGAASAHAQPAEQAWRAAWSLQVAAFAVGSDTGARADGGSGIAGTSLDFETELALAQRSTAPVLAIGWRPWARHRFGLSHFGVSRTGTAVASAAISYAGQQFAAGTAIDSRFRTEATGVDYAYAVADGERHELALGLGLYWIRLAAELSARGPALVATERADFPVPVLRAGGAAALGARWSVDAYLQGVRLTKGDYRGRLRAAALNLNYHFTPTLAATLGYREFDLKVDIERPDWIGSARSSYRGPALALTAHF